MYTWIERKEIRRDGEKNADTLFYLDVRRWKEVESSGASTEII